MKFSYDDFLVNILKTCLVGFLVLMFVVLIHVVAIHW